MESPSKSVRNFQFSELQGLVCLGAFSLLYLLLFRVSGLEFPPVWPDEVLFYSPSLDFAKNGTFRTDVLEGLVKGMEVQTLWMPPIFFISNGWVLRFFGEGLEILRIFAAIISLGSVWIFWFLLKTFDFSPGARLGASLLLISDLLFLRVGWTARMEALCLFWALFSLYILARRARPENFLPLQQWEAFLSGFFLGLSFLSHPFGAIFGIPALILIHQAKAWRAWMFWLGGLVPILAWGIWIHPHWDIFLYQFGAQFGRKKDLFQSFSPLTKIKVLLGGYESPGLRLFFYIALGLGLWVFRKEILEKFRTTFFFSCWTISILFFLILSTEYYYVMYLCVPLSALGGFFFERIKSRRVQFIAAILVFSNIAILVNAYKRIGFANSDFDLRERLYESLSQELKGSKKIYLQAIPDPYFQIRKARPDLQVLEFIPGELPIPKEDFIQTLDSIDTFVFSDRQKRNEHVQAYLEGNASRFKKIRISAEPSTLRKVASVEAEVYRRR
ncbi:UDP phosphate-alpha-4-amino-4-deoxy-L- arabinose arabinosyl transferase [Leptospira semungkisensis]|uniref:UDP phosphate-alpha-4-amino-4-deoxy-L-arabinose arabinosyl transferase n=1 Tax=Leptospira semungkisensis TaxID=2484985 RepID=A0A4R9G777_9LEPT|nr:glycosyltransferase family 39 protein [Leptospira semungkisensis]TGK07466.1 UDP phosphate-alpha-4-amino-4-deoxy-L- arabinose arabinosyl transferase [Leptospira semungkisensis]